MQLVVLRMGIALGEGACRPAGSALIAEMFPSRQRAVAGGVFSWGVRLVFVFVFPKLAQHFIQVYFGYGLSFLLGIYLTQLDVLGLVSRH